MCFNFQFLNILRSNHIPFPNFEIDFDQSFKKFKSETSLSDV